MTTNIARVLARRKSFSSPMGARGKKGWRDIIVVEWRIVIDGRLSGRSWPTKALAQRALAKAEGGSR